ncbi:uncharacterized protein G2W53_029259 [Senna tora]|uniref:Reverse transcriptase domain-containing protein n=1 Tax=Senna tora TaxID=362788 RepID=A0A834T496_9FABA|nr:uncharacterized protein G2W53_029259 [Senna tora]
MTDSFVFLIAKRPGNCGWLGWYGLELKDDGVVNGFVNGRLISDSVFLASEVMSFIHKAYKTKIAWCAFKLDIHKAYDKFSWNFLEAVLRCMEFLERFINIIMQCVHTVSYTLLLNAQIVGSFVPKRGLQQGDPLSRYLFLLCANVLSYALLKLEAAKKIVGIKFARRGPMISHLMYADDTILFFKIDDINCRAVKYALSIYSNLAGQHLNKDKSFLVFSPNITDSLKVRCPNFFKNWSIPRNYH